MRAPLLLLVHSLKRVRALVISAAVLLASFQFVLILVAASVQRSNAFSQMGALIPPFARELLGPAIGGLMSFRGIVCLGYFHLVVISSLVALCISLSTMPTGEIESGFYGSHPVASARAPLGDYALDCPRDPDNRRASRDHDAWYLDRPECIRSGRCRMAFE